jgi:hypothetical protein
MQVIRSVLAGKDLYLFEASSSHSSNRASAFAVFPNFPRLRRADILALLRNPTHAIAPAFGRTLEGMLSGWKFYDGACRSNNFLIFQFQSFDGDFLVKPRCISLALRETRFRPWSCASLASSARCARAAGGLTRSSSSPSARRASHSTP